ncbi:Homeobox-DDT domain protein RLT1 [Sesamum angolense]|uniref:Homeobox-DDT domain protein RLT1 n=1 Tax=Sesamum angolense TaxID=2727404 RepID=A0AAE1XGD9_9LAMI|nr:Homeobox-DDT domain protein RLT1 [Sesamum angolense]
MPKHGHTPDSYTYGTLINGLCRTGRTLEAKELLIDMEANGCSPSVITYSCLIHGFCQSNKLEDAMELLKDMKSKAMELLERMIRKRLVPNSITYSSLIYGFCKEGKLHEAIQILDRMKLQDLKPDAGLYSKIINGFCEINKFREAANFLDEMVLSGITPNRVTWDLHVRVHNRVIQGLCSGGHPNQAFQLYLGLRTRGISVETNTFGSLIHCLCKRGDLHKAGRIMDEMVIDGCIPDVETWTAMTGTCLSCKLQCHNCTATNRLLNNFTASPIFQSKGCEEIVSTLRKWVQRPKNAVAIMQEKGFSLQCRSRHQLTPGTVKFGAYHVLALEGSKGLNVIELAEKIQKSGLRDFTTSKTPEACISVALSRDPVLFERIAPSTYYVRPVFRKDPADAESIIAAAKEKIQRYANGFLADQNADEEERDDSDTDVAEGTEVDALATPSAENKNTDGNEVGSCSRNGKDKLLDDRAPPKWNPIDVSEDIAKADPDQGVEIDESRSLEPWVQGLIEGEYSDLSVEESQCSCRLNWYCQALLTLLELWFLFLLRFFILLGQKTVGEHGA